MGFNSGFKGLRSCEHVCKAGWLRLGSSELTPDMRSGMYFTSRPVILYCAKAYGAMSVAENAVRLITNTFIYYHYYLGSRDIQVRNDVCAVHFRFLCGSAIPLAARNLPVCWQSTASICSLWVMMWYYIRLVPIGQLPGYEATPFP